MSDVVQYFSDTGLDYATWSPHFNMHFGYWRLGLNPLRREPMLEEMNHQVFSRLGLDALGSEELILDLGCGVGASMRALARHWGSRNVLGVTVVPWQVEQAALLGSRVQLASYLDLPLEAESVAAAYYAGKPLLRPRPRQSRLLSRAVSYFEAGGPFRGGGWVHHALASGPAF